MYFQYWNVTSNNNNNSFRITEELFKDLNGVTKNVSNSFFKVQLSKNRQNLQLLYKYDFFYFDTIFNLA